jgi:hypothetical protein
VFPAFSSFHSGSLLGIRAPHRHIFAEPPPHQGDQLDVKNIFLYDTLSETIYYIQPTRFVDPT